VLTVNPKLPVASVKDLIALAKARPGKLNYGHTGVGVAPHLAAEMFRIAAGIDVVAVPYKGDAPLIPAVIADEVQFTVLPPTNVVEPARNGRLRLLAVTAKNRAASLPDVPTMAEVGLPDVEQAGWVGLFAPAATPRDTVARIAAEVGRALKTPIVANRIRATSYDPGGSTPEQFAAQFRADVTRYTRIVRQLGIPPAD
jgi:tripartite-type tricarboxylate transporter receptor subunit TctC